jgi:hypothetical protein
MVMDSPPRDQQEPLFERPFGRIVAKFRDLPRHRDYRILHYILRLVVGKAAFARDVVDEPPVRIEKRAPTGVIIHVAQAAQQTGPCAHTVVFDYRSTLAPTHAEMKAF